MYIIGDSSFKTQKDVKVLSYQYVTRWLGGSLWLGPEQSFSRSNFRGILWLNPSHSEPPSHRATASHILVRNKGIKK